MATEPLKPLGIATEHVGTPRNDGTPGSGLYRVPIQLNRRPNGREAQYLVYHWDHPTSWSTMHRPGIARVEGDLFVLDGTTVEEVRDHHIGMIKRVIDATNASEEEAAEQERRARDAAAAAQRAHEANVNDVAGQIRFDE